MIRVEELLLQTVENQELAGINLLVLKDGKEVIYSEAGYADAENKKPYKRDTISRMYSMSKPITGAAAMILMDRGILSPSQAVYDFLPGFQNQKVWENGKKTPVVRPVYLHDLLSMTSGLTYGGDPGSLASVETQELFDEIDERLYGDDPLPTVEIANRLGQVGLLFQPGRAWQYGTSADVMGAVVEKASGMRFGEFLQKELFEPLGMEDTGFYVPEEKQGRLAKAYDRTKEGLVECRTNHLGIAYTQHRPPAFESGGAGLVSTLDDYAKFARMLLGGGCFEGRRILSEEAAAYFTGGKLAPWLRESLWRSWDSLSGYNYGNFMRVMEEPGMAYFQTWKGEYGWDGWLGSYFCNSPKNGVTILMTTQLANAGCYPFTSKIRNVLAHDERIR